MKKILIFLSFALLTGCIVPVTQTSINSSSNIQISNMKSIRGVVQFPSLDFKIKADVSDVSTQATVSIIYPHDSINANKVISTTVSDSNGVFDLNLTIEAEVNEIFILEASKRLGGVGSNIMSLRTYIKWTGNEWQSMTSNGIYINSYTNALAVIAGYNKDKISSNDTIGKIAVNGNTVTVSDIGTSPNIVIGSTVSTVKDLVNTALSNNNDPFQVIKFDNGNYFIDNSGNIGDFINTFIANNGCSCDLRDKDLKNISLKGKNLSGANLSGLDLTDKDLSGTNLSNANLSNSNLSYMDLSATNLTGANLSDAYLVGAQINSNSTLLGTDFTYGFLKDSDLSGSTINSSTIFANADLSNAKWLDHTETNPHICADESFGQCN